VTHTHNAYLAWCRDRYGVLLILTVLNYVILMVLPADTVATLVETLVVAVTALFALDVCAAPRKARITCRALVACLPVMPVLYLGFHLTRLKAFIPLSLGLMIGAITVLILLALVGHEKINMATLLGALDIYLLIGIAFAQLFIAFAMMGIGEPFLAQTPHPDRSQLVYLSYVTLTTVGFGDLTPLSKVARTLVITEALVGQVFLVTAVARVVSLFGTTQRTKGAKVAELDRKDTDA
jgi:voltage-gated potassium channel Kch